MKDSRAGEALWKEWTGVGYTALHEDSIVFFTEDHIDLEIDVVKRALASALQRDGVVDSLGQGYRLLENMATLIKYGYAGEISGDVETTVCDENGETRDGDLVEITLDITWVEVQTR